MLPGASIMRVAIRVKFRLTLYVIIENGRPIRWAMAGVKFRENVQSFGDKRNENCRAVAVVANGSNGRS